MGTWFSRKIYLDRECKEVPERQWRNSQHIPKRQCGGIWENDRYAIYAYQQQLQDQHHVPLQVMVAHYTPSNFPIVPMVDAHIASLCARSWEKIIADVSGEAMSGMTTFYTEFYDRLEVYDSNGMFDALLTKHSSGTNKIAAKGAILLRIVKFVLAIREDNADTQMKLYMLGKSHSHKGIRPYQYSIFVQVLLQTISSRLGVEATGDVMEAWVNLFAFVMKSMIPSAIQGKVIETELFINTSSVFSDGKIAEEVHDAEEMREFHKKLGKSTGSRTPGALSARSTFSMHKA